MQQPQHPKRGISSEAVRSVGVSTHGLVFTPYRTKWGFLISSQIIQL